MLSIKTCFCVHDMKLGIISLDSVTALFAVTHVAVMAVLWTVNSLSFAVIHSCGFVQ